MKRSRRRKTKGRQSMGIETRLAKLESAAGVACPHCGRLCDDAGELARLNAKSAAHPFDFDEYAALFRRRMERDDEQNAAETIERLIDEGRLIRAGD